MSESILAYKNGDKEFRIEIGTSEKPVIYQVIGMIDHEAPDAFKEKRTTKIIDPTVSNTVRPVRFDTRINMYDTGLHEMSSALQRLYPSDADRKRALAQLTKEVLNPWGKIRGIKNLEPDSLTFWDEYRHEIVLDKAYNTAKPEDLALLYQLVLHGKLAPEGLESEPFFRGTAQYAVENKETVVDAGQKRKFAVSNATAKFFNLYETDKEGLSNILAFMGVTIEKDQRFEDINDIFTEWLSRDDNQNPQEFLKLYAEYYDSKSGKQEMVMFKTLQDLSRVRKITKTLEGFYLDGEFIGATLKSASKLVLTNQDLLDKVLEKKGL
jgi:hypothetical protein